MNRARREKSVARTTPDSGLNRSSWKEAWVRAACSPWGLALFGAALYWLSLPPAKQPWAAYVACGLWVAIIARDTAPTRGEYWRIWWVSTAMWLALLQGIRLASWPLYFGWVALSLYAAVYLPLFIGMARSLHHGFRFPLPIAAAVAWVGCELLRAYFATGFAACMLAHSQVPWPWMLPIASHLGSYGVSLLVMFLSALAWEWLDWVFWKRKILARHVSVAFLSRQSTFTLLAAAAVIASVLSLSWHDRWIAEQSPIKPLARILLIQEDMPTVFDGPPENYLLGWNRYERQTSLAAEAVGENGVDLVVWPESTFSRLVPWIDRDRQAASQPDVAPDRIREIEEWMDVKAKRISSSFRNKPPLFLLGQDVVRLTDSGTRQFNAALWLDSEHVEEAEYYAKRHLVMFGEYIPFLATFTPQWLSGLGLPNLDPGDGPKAWRLRGGATVSCSICFEDVLPHVIHSHVRGLTDLGKSPDMLVNLTNDAWFRGSSILDHHLNNAILVAVENRRPMLVAANTGISAWIDGNGRVIRALPYPEAGFILAEPIPDGRWGWWQSVGDWPVRFLTVLCFLPTSLWLAKWFFWKRALPGPTEIKQ